MGQTAMDAAFSSRVLNATLPTGTGGSPGTALAVTGVGATAMKLKITSTASTGSASGTDIGAQTGYAAAASGQRAGSALAAAGNLTAAPMQVASAALDAEGTLAATSTTGEDRRQGFLAAFP